MAKGTRGHGTRKTKRYAPLLASSHPQGSLAVCRQLTLASRPDNAAAGGPVNVADTTSPLGGPCYELDCQATSGESGLEPPTPPLRSAPHPWRLTALPHCAQQRSLPITSIRHVRRPKTPPSGSHWWPEKLPSRLSSGEAPPTKSRTAALGGCPRNNLPGFSGHSCCTGDVRR